MEKETFTLETKEGNIECEILMSLFLEENQKNYLVYTDNEKDEEGDLNIFISSIGSNSKINELNDITDEKELEIVTNYIAEIWSEKDANE